MHALATAAAGFLLAVLWFDLMFDVQVRSAGGGSVPERTLTSIAAYYRRVTTDASPMNRLVAAAMAVLVFSLGWQLAGTRVDDWVPAVSLLLALPPIGYAGAVLVPAAKRLATLGLDDPGGQQTASTLAHRLHRGHLACFAAIAGVLAVQLLGA